MEKEQILENLATSIVDGDEDMALENVRTALEMQMDPLETVEQGLHQIEDQLNVDITVE